MKKMIAAISMIALATAANAKTGWYLGAKGGINMTNHGYVTPDGTADEKVSFGMAPNIELNFGQWIKKNWRIQIDLGMITEYQDKESFGVDGHGDAIIFTESVKYANFDGLWTYDSGFYLGFGAGMAIIDTKQNLQGSNDVQTISPMGQLLIGQELKLDESWSFDIGGKASLWYGSEQDYGLGYKFGTGLTYNLTALAGVKYYF
ncbi:MAG: hypothetical protein LBL46_02985 [Rickettsiales bacterium]|jgi:hypothetical protein|nr:hypothetical protein [Rickettsiales bacterium]